jgi:hypothetical protein
MNEIFYDHIRQQNERLLRTVQMEKELQALRPEQISLRARLLLYTSDALLGLGQRIRPKELRPHVQFGTMKDCGESVAHLT